MAKIRYVSQRDSYSCGPIAIINTLKFLGINITYKALPYIRMLCNCKINYGTDEEDIENVLKMFGIRFKGIHHPTLKEIDKHIECGGAILLNYSFGIDIGHYTLCIGRNKTNYFLVNDMEGKTVSDCHRKLFMYMTEWEKLGQRKPYCWFIYPEKVDEKKIKKHCGTNKKTSRKCI